MRNRFTIDTDIVFDSEPGNGDQDPDTPSPDSHEPLLQQPSPGMGGVLTGGDTDRWVEEQFDLEQYEDPDDVKETDILSDDDDDDGLCQGVRGMAAEARLEGSMAALDLEEDTLGEKPQMEGEEEEEGKQRSSEAATAATEAEEEEAGDLKPHRAPGPFRLSHLGKQCAMSVASVDEQPPSSQDEVIWVRRDDQATTPDSEAQNNTQS